MHGYGLTDGAAIRGKGVCPDDLIAEGRIRWRLHEVPLLQEQQQFE